MVDRARPARALMVLGNVSSGRGRGPLVEVHCGLRAKRRPMETWLT